ncbi:glycosyltransferase family 4 protein [Lacinutrix algicola]|uniref:glycosyltransferase family 4 protein n=1 Tax=Lacinutrix algicola TaxID=342954 RepID=UPI0006E2B462|nr:glycosyltransferase family 4 protein [Lacinutrix algicola]
MRVLQLIDSLHPGGAERVAVNIANALASSIEKSYLCVTREEGLLKESLNPQIHYLFLDKNKTIDVKAIKVFSAFVKFQKIDIIHAHSTSFFLATIIKVLNKNVKIVWHDHYGNSEFLRKRSYKMLKKCSRSFSIIYSVNKELEDWARLKLSCKTVAYLPNFAVLNKVEGKTKLKGIENKRIIHLANLRDQKDHFTLLRGFSEVVKLFPDWTLHCVGKDFKDAYSHSIRQEIKALQLENNVFIYGSKFDISNILSQTNIAVLSSKSEGLPIALLEYGFSCLPVVVTNVGECGKVILGGKLGALISSNDSVLLAKAITNYIKNPELAKEKAVAFKAHVFSMYSSKAVIGSLISNYNIILEAK